MSGPASNLLSQMGLSLPIPPKMCEDRGSSFVNDDEETLEIDSDDEANLTQVNDVKSTEVFTREGEFMNPHYKMQDLDESFNDKNYFLNNSSLD